MITLNKNDSLIAKTFILRSDSIIGEQTIPLFDVDAFAGVASLFLDNAIPIDTIVIPDLPKCDGAVHVRGDSMVPLLNPGDIILYKKTNSRRGGLYFGEMYLVEFVLDGEEYIVVKYVYESERPGHYKLVSTNPKYPPKHVPIDNVRTMALVKASIRINRIE